MRVVMVVVMRAHAAAFWIHAAALHNRAPGRRPARNGRHVIALACPERCTNGAAYRGINDTP
ncbi:Hypothetical protein I596_1464 [Dokdonella koreensis DS-123]|uniref:Secreted protein n=1 Tax=Dokdonella koreensis DS-123 TaxID=1300342 RepID=A0A160DTZ1_9GAMM|nr:Hypothetical protein I596_1464 [Dokdonella koreensis DS-123]